MKYFKKILNIILVLTLFLQIPINAEDISGDKAGESTEIIEVSASKESSYTVTLPKTLDVSQNTTTFDVTVQGDINSNETITVSMNDTTLTKLDINGKPTNESIDVNVDFAGGKSQSYKYDDIISPNIKQTTLTHDTIDFGSWVGSLIVNISVNEDSSLNIVSWTDGTDEEIVAMIEAADRGEIDLGDHWKVGDIRKVTLKDMPVADGVDESHASQEIELVLMHEGGYFDENGKEVNFIVGQKNSLNERGYMNEDESNTGSWEASARRAWCNNTYYNSYPDSIKPIFKKFKTITAKEYNSTELSTSLDYFALPAVKEVFGDKAGGTAGSNTAYSNLTEWNALFHFDYYKDPSNRIKLRNGSAGWWWERSPSYNSSIIFCGVNNGGRANYDLAYISFGLAPFGCI